MILIAVQVQTGSNGWMRVLFANCMFFSGFDADELDEVRETGKAAERLLPARLVLSPAG